jgi:hypothetical protein
MPATPAAQTPAAVTPAQPPAATRTPKRGRLRRFVRRGLLLVAILMVLNEIRIYNVAAALAQNVPQDLAGVVQMWNQHGTLNDGMGLGVRPLERALRLQSLALAERTFARYRTAGTTVYEREWQGTRDALTFALRTNPSSVRFKAALRYCEGHLQRIVGEARIRDKQAPAAQEALAASLSAFRSAAELRQNWPDPFLGLMRTFVAMDDMEHASEAMAQAEKYGYTSTYREWALLGEGYFARAVKLAESQELGTLNRAAEAYAQAIDHFSKAVGYGNISRRLRETQRRLADVQERIATLSTPIDRGITS